ncbi:MAG: bifunctional 4-hydroxy-2-oxoglutarate aldolase/2-dehydro-3-deoxy-phosphogluconate aldolase [Alphaproteobacteria bacterium]|nr:bifunctional 4-hydroxy-2-oxoglutarate aldolase/2-dehydro-3-deoxy-phosphogluconate aldolase [Alphaproteobacteria bacterium]
MTATPREALDQALRRCRVLPVVAGVRADDVVQLAEVLVQAGVTTIELTLRTPDALDALDALAGAGLDLIVGAGTVRTPEQLAAVVDRGARFAVSPGLTDRLAHAARDVPIPLVPGVATASEVMRAVDHGFDLLKLFPAEAIGGLPTLQALAAPFPDVRFVPTGGISPARARQWLAEPAVVAVGGSWVAPREAIQAGRWDSVAARAREAAELQVTQGG